MQPIMFNNVVLPEPEAPIIATNSPVPIFKLIFFKAGVIISITPVFFCYVF